MANAEHSFQIRRQVVDAYNLGHSAAVIARQCGLSRGAVIGLVNRCAESGHFQVAGAHLKTFQGWTEGKQLDLLAMREPLNGSEPWPWQDVAAYFGRPEAECRKEYDAIKNAPPPSDGAILTKSKPRRTRRNSSGPRMTQRAAEAQITEQFSRWRRREFPDAAPAERDLNRFLDDLERDKPELFTFACYKNGGDKRAVTRRWISRITISAE